MFGKQEVKFLGFKRSKILLSIGYKGYSPLKYEVDFRSFLNAIIKKKVVFKAIGGEAKKVAQIHYKELSERMTADLHSADPRLDHLLNLTVSGEGLFFKVKGIEEHLLGARLQVDWFSKEYSKRREKISDEDIDEWHAGLRLSEFFECLVKGEIVAEEHNFISALKTKLKKIERVNGKSWYDGGFDLHGFVGRELIRVHSFYRGFVELKNVVDGRFYRIKWPQFLEGIIGSAKVERKGVFFPMNLKLFKLIWAGSEISNAELKRRMNASISDFVLLKIFNSIPQDSFKRSHDLDLDYPIYFQILGVQGENLKVQIIFKRGIQVGGEDVFNADYFLKLVDFWWYLRMNNPTMVGRKLKEKLNLKRVIPKDQLLLDPNNFKWRRKIWSELNKGYYFGPEIALPFMSDSKHSFVVEKIVGASEKIGDRDEHLGLDQFLIDCGSKKYLIDESNLDYSFERESIIVPLTEELLEKVMFTDGASNLRKFVENINVLELGGSVVPKDFSGVKSNYSLGIEMLIIHRNLCHLNLFYLKNLSEGGIVREVFSTARGFKHFVMKLTNGDRKKILKSFFLSTVGKKIPLIFPEKKVSDIFAPLEIDADGNYVVD